MNSVPLSHCTIVGRPPHRSPASLSRRDVAPVERPRHLERDTLARVDVDEREDTHQLPSRQHVVHEVHRPALIRLRHDSAWLPHRGAPPSTPAGLQLQPFLDAEAVDFLVIDLDSITPPHHVESVRAEARPILRDLVQPAAHRGIVRLDGFVAHDRAMDHQRATRSTLAKLVRGLRPSHDRAALTAVPLGLTIFSECIPQNRLVERQIGDRGLQAPVLFAQLFDSSASSRSSLTSRPAYCFFQR